jgi:hypothetical protein
MKATLSSTDFLLALERLYASLSQMDKHKLLHSVLSEKGISKA